MREDERCQPSFLAKTLTEIPQSAPTPNPQVSASGCTPSLVTITTHWTGGTGNNVPIKERALLDKDHEWPGAASRVRVRWDASENQGLKFATLLAGDFNPAITQTSKSGKKEEGLLVVLWRLCYDPFIFVSCHS
jgi:hypothetical protein